MASIIYTFIVRDNSGSNGGTRMTGLTPTFVHLKKLSDNSNVTQPSITEIGQGQYKFAYDAEANGEAAAQIDAGNTLADPADRYVDLVLALDSSRIQSGIGSDGYVNTDPALSVDLNADQTVLLDLTQAVPTSNTAQTVGDALNAARAQGFGKWAISGTTLSLYAANGTTVIKAFTLDSASAPTSRT